MRVFNSDFGVIIENLKWELEQVILHQIKKELLRTMNWKQIIIWVILIIPLPIIKFLMVDDGYIYNRQIEVFLRVNSDFVPLLFPLLIIAAYTPRFIGEQKNNFLLYVNSRISLKDYFYVKLIVNIIISFFIAFFCVFIPFLFIMYIEPNLNIVTISPIKGNIIPITTFEQFLTFGTFIYGLIYSSWVGINGVLYATFALLLLMISEKPLVSLTTPFIYYIFGNFLTQLLNYDKFSPGSTIFPFSISIQPLWTVLVPFCVLLMIVLILFYILKRQVGASYE